MIISTIREDAKLPTRVNDMDNSKEQTFFLPVKISNILLIIDRILINLGMEATYKVTLASIVHAT